MDLRYNSEVKIPVNKVLLEGELVVPFKATAIVIFSHGSELAAQSLDLSGIGRELMAQQQERQP